MKIASTIDNSHNHGVCFGGCRLAITFYRLQPGKGIIQAQVDGIGSGLY